MNQNYPTRCSKPPGREVVAHLRVIGTGLANKLDLHRPNLGIAGCFRLPQDFLVHRQIEPLGVEVGNDALRRLGARSAEICVELLSAGRLLAAGAGLVPDRLREFDCWMDRRVGPVDDILQCHRVKAGCSF
jgi:hypothetical protein